MLAVSCFVFYKLFIAYDIDRLFLDFKSEGAFGSKQYLIFALLFGFFNWALEALKWKKIIQKYEPVSFSLATKAVFSGATLSIITPNHIGDFAGRVLHLQILDKIKGSLATVIGHTSQVLVTCIFGAYALWVFGDIFFKFHWAFVTGIAFVLIALLAYFKMGWLYKHISSVKLFSKLTPYLDVFGDFSSKELAQILLIAMLRYILFTSQYLLLLKFYQVEVPLLDAVACLAGTFFVQSVVPSFLLLEIGLRGASALWFFTLYSSNVTGILLAAYSLWMINMLLPALAGLYFIYKVK
jgi:hypothetical protein